MALKMRMARRGAKKRPFYHIVVADARASRDGSFIEKVGTFNPLLPKDSDTRVVLNTERVQHWLSQGAQPTDRVAVFLGKAGLAEMPKQGNNPQKAKPKAKAQERLREKAEKAEAAAEAARQAEEEAKAAAAAPAEEPVAEETPAAEATEAPAEDAEETKEGA